MDPCRTGWKVVRGGGGMDFLSIPPTNQGDFCRQTGEHFLWNVDKSIWYANDIGLVGSLEAGSKDSYLLR